MVAAVHLLLCNCSAMDSSPCLELNRGSLNRSACEALSAGFTSVHCCGAALDPYTPPPPRIATATRSYVRSIDPAEMHRFWLPYLLSVAILLQASLLPHPPALARLGAHSRTRSMRFTTSPLLTPQVCRVWFGRAPKPRCRARAAKQRIKRTEATRKVGRLVLGLLLALAHKASAFAHKSSLAGALREWCADASGAQATHGHISTWDVRAVTDLSRLVYSAPCRNTFDEDVNAWDVGRVTSMDVRCRLFSGVGWGGADRAGAWLGPHVHSWSGARSDGVRAGAGNVQRGGLFQSTRQCMERWQGHQHVGALPPESWAGGPGAWLSAHAHSWPERLPSGELVRFVRRR